MPTPSQLLKQDHRKVEKLFEQYNQSPEAGLVEQICTELKVHTTIEEEVVYPVLKSDVPGGKEMEAHAEDEHDEVETAIKEIERIGYDANGVDRLMQEIIKGVTEHVEEEETEVLPAFEDAIPQSRQEKLAAQLEQAKKNTMAKLKGGQSGNSGGGTLIDLTKEELYERAKKKGIEGRSTMNKRELVRALQKT